MKYAGRMNSFVFKGRTVLDAIKAYKAMNDPSGVQLPGAHTGI